MKKKTTEKKLSSAVLPEKIGIFVCERLLKFLKCVKNVLDFPLTVTKMLFPI